jgi:dGTPase
MDLELHTHASAEAQVAALSDDIAYNNHDLHDGLRAGLFQDDEITHLPIIGAAYAEVDRKYPGLDPLRRRHEALRRVFGVMVGDVIDTARQTLIESGVQSVEEVRALGRPVVVFSPDLWRDLKEIRAFLFRRMYRAPSVMEVRVQMARVVEALFPYFLANPLQMPERWHEEIKASEDKVALARITSDYIAGMTDRFALQQHEQLKQAGLIA